MTSNALLKAHSRQMLTYGYVFLMLASLIYRVISLMILGLTDLVLLPGGGAANFILGLFVSLFLSVVVMLLETGYCFIALNIVRAGSAKIRDLFLGFRYHTGRLTILSLILCVVRYLCALPAMYAVTELIFEEGKINLFGHMVTALPAVVLLTAGLVLLSLVLYAAVYLLFSQALFLFIDNQDFTAVRCLSESIRLMRGKRIRLFLLNLSFIGYWLLVVLSFGIADLCVKPYVEVTHAQFYVELSGQRDPYGK